MAERQLHLEEVELESYPLDKEEAERLLRLMEHPDWQLFERCLRYEAQVYAKQAMFIGYGPLALEKFRFNQALANNLPRIPMAIAEAARIVLDEQKDLNSLYDDLHLNE